MTQAAITPRPRMRVLSMPEYHPPLGNRHALRLDFNENTLACSPAVERAIRSMTAAELTRYPEREPVEAVAANHLGLTSDQVVLTNGVDEAIHLLCEAFLEAGDEVLLPVPTYTMYAIYASATDSTLRTVQSDTAFAFPFEALNAAISPRTKLIAIANPNSPTGSVATRQQLIALAQAAPHSILLVDEAYFHFYGETVLDLIGTLPNLIVARTFSKAYGLAALRLGLLAGPASLLRWVRRVLSPYSVNFVALTALGAALGDTGYVDWYVAQIKQARAEFLTALDSIGLEHWPTEANFVLVNIGHAHDEFVTSMRGQGILTRDRSADPGCDGLVRITIGTPEQMGSVVSAIRSFVSKHKLAGAAR